MAQMDIPLVLSKATSLSEEQIKSVLGNPAISKPFSILETLSEKNFSTAEELVESLCHELGLDFLRDIPVSEISGDIVRNLPINYAKNQGVLPYREEADCVVMLTSNPVNTKAMDDIRVLFGKRVKPVVTTAQRLQDTINRVYEKSTSNLSGMDEIEDDEMDLEDPIIDLLEAGEDDAPVIKLVNSVLFRAVKEKASDIHIEPYEKDMVVRYRVDGILYDIFKPPKKLQNAITSRIKVMANLNIAEKRLPQDGRIPLKVGGKDIDIRLSTVPTTHGERIVMRLQDKSSQVRELYQMGFSEDTIAKIDDLIARSYGILIVTGPTGSGKSTTLYGCLSKLNKPDINILTVEDPVEQRIHGVGQVQVNSKIGLTFAAGLRSFLRQDPDVIMVGEVRDLETAELAINSSLTGHLVLTTIHANDAAGAFPRLMDIGCEPFLIATSVMGVLEQRLVRILCTHCKAAYTPSDFDLVTLGLTRAQLRGAQIFKAMGCEHCGQKGYFGRTLIAEVLTVNDEIKSLIMQKTDGGALKKLAVANGMKTFRDHGIQKVLAGITTIEELISNTQMDI